jgi:predicted ATPase/DNA-binding CsgD family transcriptional regulator
MKEQPVSLNNLPHSLNSFIGRSSELGRVRGLVADPSTRLVTITGPGGVGKTRLALEVARLVGGDFKDGVWWVDLAQVTPAGPVSLAQVIAQAGGIFPANAVASLADLQALLNPKELLLLLDNCEHLILDCATLVEALLKSCPGVQILATSRERLGLDGEKVLPLAPLALPEKTTDLTPQELLTSEAAQLFLQRVQEIRPGFQPDAETAGMVARICCRLDGLPLALELAAAKMRGLGVANLAARLDDRFRLLTTENRLALPRQQTLRSLLDWSYNLLAEREQTVFARLAVFNGAIPLEAVEFVCAGPYETPHGHGHLESSQVLEILLGLVNKSLVQAETGAAGDVVRYRLLETLREYALQKLRESNPTDSDRVQERLLDWCLQTALEARSGLESKDQARWLRRLQQEHYHFNAALSWALAVSREGERLPVFEKALELAITLAAYWQRQGMFLEGEKWCLALMTQPDLEKIAPTRRAEFLHWAGILSNTVNAAQARQLHLQTLDLYGTQGNLAGQVKSLTELAWQAFYQVDAERAAAYARQALALAGHLPSLAERLPAYYIRAVTAEKLGDLTTAETCGEICLKSWREAGDTGSIASIVTLLAEVAAQRGEFEKARRFLLENIELQTKFDSPLSNWVCLKGVINVLLRWDATPGSRQTSQQTALPLGWATLAGWLGAIAQAQIRMGGSPPPMTRQLFDGLRQAVRAKMEPATFEMAWTEGHTLPLAPALAQARTLLEEIEFRPVSSRQKAFDELTARELEVLRLLSQGLTNAAIAQSLTVTPRTVNAHLTSIYSKLGFSSRAETIRFVFETGLV